MDKNLKYIIIFIAYFILINLIFNFIAVPNYNPLDNITSKSSGGTQVSLGVSDSVAVSVVRPRVYGTYYETSYSDGKVVVLYVLKYIKIPIRSFSLNFVIAHIIFIIALTVYIINERRKKHEKKLSSTNNYSY